MKVRCPICQREVFPIQLRTGRNPGELICPSCHNKLSSQKPQTPPQPDRIQRIFKALHPDEDKK